MKRLILLLTVVVAAPAAVRADHSLAATYHLDETRVIEGYVAQISVREPHSLMHVITMNADGTSDRWTAEWRRIEGDIQSDEPLQVRVGDFVRVVGHPDQNSDVHRLLIVKVMPLFGGPSTD